MAEIYWNTSTNGNWSTGGEWSGGVSPGILSNVDISGAPGGLRAAANGTLHPAAAGGDFNVTIDSQQSVNNLTIAVAGTVQATASLTLGRELYLATGTFALWAGGQVVGGTIAEGHGLLLANGGSLNDVAVQGALNLSASGASLGIVNGIALSGVGGVGFGSASVTGANSYLGIQGATSLNDATISLGSNTGQARLGLSDGTAPAGTTQEAMAAFVSASNTLTLGADLTVNQAGAFADIRNAGAHAGDAIVNQGTIVAGFSGGQMSVYGGTFSNQGSLLVSNGNSVRLTSSAFTNYGLVSDVNGGSLSIAPGGSWSNQGTITETNATLALGGTFSSATLESVQRSGGVLELAGTVVNTGGTLDVGTGSALGSLVLNGTILGGTVHDAGGGIGAGSGAVLDGVVYQGALGLSAANAQLGIVNGITLRGAGGSGAGSVNLTGNNSALLIDGPMTLDAANISIGSASISRIAFQNESAGAGSLTLGSQLTITQAGANARIDNADRQAGDLIVNQGTIDATFSGGNFTIYGKGGFTNLGVISVGAGDSLHVSTSSFTNAGSIDVAAGGTLTIAPTGLWANTGAFSATEATVTLGGSFSSATLKSLTLSNDTLTVGGVLDNTGSVLALGAGSAIGALGLSGSIVGGTIQNAAGGLAALGGTLSGVDVQGMLDLSAANAALSIAGGIVLTGSNGVGPGGVDLTGSRAMLVVDAPMMLGHATIEIGSTGGDTLAFTDHGSVGGALTLGANLDIVQAGRLATIQDSYVRAGDAIVNDGAIAATYEGGQFYISGRGAFTNAGTITIGNGDTLHDAGAALLNRGRIAGTSGGGTLLAGVVNTGTIEAVAGTLVLAGSLSGTGALVADAGAVLDATAGGLLTGRVAGAGTLRIDGGAGFGFGTGSSLQVGTVAQYGSVTVGNGGTAASVTLTNASGHVWMMEGAAGSTETLAPNGNGRFVNAGSFSASGGTADVSVAFVNKGDVSVGSGTLSFLGALANTGTMTTAGGTLSSAGMVSGTGTLNIGAGSLLSLQNGAATTQSVSFLASTGLLDLQAPSAFGATIKGFSASNHIDLLNVQATGASFAAGVLTVDNSHGSVASLHFDGSYTTANFVIGSDTHGGSLIGFHA